METTGDGWNEERLYRVLLNLSSGDWVEVDSFAAETEAEACAQGLAEQLATTSEWPRIRGRYLRPVTITAIEISERRRLERLERPRRRLRRPIRGIAALRLRAGRRR